VVGNLNHHRMWQRKPREGERSLSDSREEDRRSADGNPV
jgi:hypothetical protein